MYILKILVYLQILFDVNLNFIKQFDFLEEISARKKFSYIDERMVRNKGRYSFPQFIRDKPTK